MVATNYNLLLRYPSVVTRKSLLQQVIDDVCRNFYKAVVILQKRNMATSQQDHSSNIQCLSPEGQFQHYRS